MKNIIFTSIVFLCQSFLLDRVDAQYTQIPDVNFELFLEENGMGDGIYGNGQVLTANIENVTELLLNDNTTNNNISDLTGLKDFIALETFGCAFNPVTEIDLSHNTNLKLLGIMYTPMTYLDLSALENLEDLYIIGNNHVNTVILGNKPYLTSVEAYENAIHTIDFNQCPALENLIIYDNELTELDISQNPNLFWLWVSINALHELDTSQNPNLGALFTSYNNISHYDLSQNPELYIFSEGHNNALTYIDVRNGQNDIIEHFAVIASPNLNCIYVDDPDAPYLDDWMIDASSYFASDEAECEALHNMDTEEFFAKKMAVFPNPVKEKLYVLNLDLEITKITVSDISGRVIYLNPNPEKQVEIDFSSYPKGVYFVGAESDGKTYRTEKIIKN